VLDLISVVYIAAELLVDRILVLVVVAVVVEVVVEELYMLLVDVVS
jgi:hypothetical protein